MRQVNHFFFKGFSSVPAARTLFLAGALQVAISAMVPLPASAEQITVTGKDVRLISHGVDDKIKCTLDGVSVLSGAFGPTTRTVNLTNKLSKGLNKIRCSVYDNQEGSCYAYDIELLVDNSESIRDSLSCCKQSCAVNGANGRPVFTKAYDLYN
jgi:hypothetical protein